MNQAERIFPMSRAGFFFILILMLATGLAAAAAGQSHVPSHRIKKGSICGNPMVACKTTVTFQPNDLPFRVPANSVIFDTEPFYAIVLKSVKFTEDNCQVFIPETERLAAQALFPDHKVFTSRCFDPEELFYADVSRRKVRHISETHRIMAVYAGKTAVEAKRFLEAVKATGKFPGANIRRMRTGFNGT